MKFAIRFLSLGLFLFGLYVLVTLVNENRELSESVRRLEAELGRMPIDDEDQVHLVAIESPRIPPEVAPHVDRIWQFRCYLPPGYDYLRRSGSGRVAADGLYNTGGFGSSWSSPNADPTHELLTISLGDDESGEITCLSHFGGSTSTSSWSRFLSDDVYPDGIAAEALVSPGGPARSFDRDTILPILKLYDPTTAEEKEVEGQTLTTYAGGMFVMCPKSREAELDQLREGKTPEGFEADSVAAGLPQ